MSSCEAVGSSSVGVTVFSTFDKDQSVKIYRHCWKGRLKISNLAEFESDMSETSEDIALQILKILQTFVWWGHKLAPTIQTPIKFCDFAEPFRC